MDKTILWTNDILNSSESNFEKIDKCEKTINSRFEELMNSGLFVSDRHLYYMMLDEMGVDSYIYDFSHIPDDIGYKMIDGEIRRVMEHKTISYTYEVIE